MYHNGIQLVYGKVPNAADHKEEAQAVHKRLASKIYPVDNAERNGISLGNYGRIR